MILAVVKGNVVSTNKTEKLQGGKLLIVEEWNIDTRQASGQPKVALDLVGAGEGELVMCVCGSSARQTEQTDKRPVDMAIIGIVDQVEMNGASCYKKYPDRGKETANAEAPKPQKVPAPAAKPLTGKAPDPAPEEKSEPAKEPKSRPEPVKAPAARTEPKYRPAPNLADIIAGTIPKTASPTAPKGGVGRGGDAARYRNPSPEAASAERAR
jgi:ethanolamine utilization protein EutN/carbon dioxide concentrating mechanism protein CcmL